MRAFLECVPCVMRQALEAALHATADRAVQEEVLRRTAHTLSQADLREASPVIIAVVHRIVRDVTGLADPYAEAKTTCNEKALALYPHLKEMVRRSEKPLETALGLAAAGNMLDFIVDSTADRSDLATVMAASLSEPFPAKMVSEFQHAVQGAQELLYLGDNAGEIVLDRVLIEQFSGKRITFVVKGAPVVNDVTIRDAEAVGMTGLVRVIDNGSDLPGTVLKYCSESFRQEFHRADLVISKGQGNYESLSDADKDIFFLFKAKCAPIAEHLRCQVGRSILRRTKPA
ncbi:MAG: DUF89 family protein [Desulfomonile tiedjei]|nr:DUF89 family protein [Desulfomonile tiedjei]